MGSAEPKPVLDQEGSASSQARRRRLETPPRLEKASVVNAASPPIAVELRDYIVESPSIIAIDPKGLGSAQDQNLITVEPERSPLTQRIEINPGPNQAIVVEPGTGIDPGPTSGPGVAVEPGTGRCRP